MRILIATVQVPFVRGGAEILADGLCQALRRGGHEAEIVALPFQWSPIERLLDQMLAWRLMDLRGSVPGPVDLVLGLKFPAYLIDHPRKVLWLLHQHRQVYDLWDYPNSELRLAPHGLQVREAVVQADRRFLADARGVFTIAGNVSRRLRHYCDVASTPLYHPPQHAEQLYCADAEDYFFFPSRVNPLKRQELVLQALALTRHPVRVRFAGAADNPAYLDELQALVRRHGLEGRVEWLGQVDEAAKRRLYAHCAAVVFPPLDEDYGYVTLEAMLAAKPVVTCTDSGGPLEFVEPGRTGCVAEPTAEALAGALDDLWADRDRAREWGRQGRARYEGLNISWPNVVERLLSCA